MSEADINKFRAACNHILDWSAIDIGTKVVLARLIDEVAHLLRSDAGK